MKTDFVDAYALLANDIIVENDNVIGTVTRIDDDGDFIAIVVTDDNGEHTERRYPPFEPVNILVSLDDDTDDVLV